MREILYRFVDAPVPPPFHRSYVIMVSPETVAAEVQCYGEVLERTERKIEQEEFARLLVCMNRHRIRKHEFGTPDEGCSGGTAEQIECRGEEGVVFSAWAYHCGGQSWGDLDGDVGGFASQLKSLIPSFEELLE